MSDRDFDVSSEDEDDAPLTDSVSQSERSQEDEGQDADENPDENARPPLA